MSGVSSRDKDEIKQKIKQVDDIMKAEAAKKAKAAVAAAKKPRMEEAEDAVAADDDAELDVVAELEAELTAAPATKRERLRMERKAYFQGIRDKRDKLRVETLNDTLQRNESLTDNVVERTQKKTNNAIIRGIERERREKERETRKLVNMSIRRGNKGEGTKKVLKRKKVRTGKKMNQKMRTQSYSIDRSRSLRKKRKKRKGTKKNH